MRKSALLIVGFILACFYSYAQDMPVNKETGKIAYEEVVDVSGASKNDLYAKAKEWFVKGTGATKSALEIDEKEEGKLIGKLNVAVSSKNPPAGMFEVGVVSYSVSVLIKDGKYKYIFTDFIHESGGIPRVVSAGPLEAKKTSAKAITQTMPTQYQWGQIKKNVHETVTKQAESLKKAMSGKGDMDF